MRPITVAHVDLAIEITARLTVSDFEASLLAAARLAGCATVFSKDFHDGRDCGGVRVENPLPT